MENHPIPQDVTGFQFKLIGDMTIKQFVYLAIGVVSGWVFFSLPITPFIKFPVAAICILSGISFAFLPLAGRPVDVMVGNFIKSLFNPTQYVYGKITQEDWQINTQTSPQDTTFKEKPANTSQASQSPNPNAQTQTEPIANSSHSSNPYIISMNDETANKSVGKQKEDENSVLQEKEEKLEKKPEDTIVKQQVLDQKAPTSSDVHQKVLGLEDQLQEILSQKEQLVQQIVDLQKKLSVEKKTILVPSDMDPKSQTQNVKKIPQGMNRKLGLPVVPDTPNIISGVVKDPRGNALPNILVEVKNKDGNSVRAFKTSLLGQFASATPLANGVYTVEFLDPKVQNKFDVIELSVTGEIIMPLEIKSQDPREELRKSLFAS